MRISLRDHHGKELDIARIDDVRQAPAEAMLLLAKFGCLYPGSLLTFDDDNDPHRHDPDTLMTVSAGNIRSLAGRLEQRASVMALVQPLSAKDLQLAARLCRHVVKVGWVITSVAIA